MRFVAVVAWLVCAPIGAQELAINGYSKIVVPRSQDYFTYDAGLRKAARDAGFEVHRSVEEIARDAWPKTLYITARLDTRAFALYVVVYHAVLQAPIAVCAWDRNSPRLTLGTPGRSSDKGVELVLKALIDNMGYRGFEQTAYEANLRARNLVTMGTEPSTASTAPASPARLRMSCGSSSSGGERADGNQD